MRVGKTWSDWWWKERKRREDLLLDGFWQSCVGERLKEEIDEAKEVVEEDLWA